MKRAIALMLTITLVFTLIPADIIAQDEEITDSKIKNALSPVVYGLPTSLGAEPTEDIIINSPSGILYNRRVSYEIVTAGKTGKTDADTRSAVVRFTLNSPGDQPVTFGYEAVYGSAEGSHLTGTLSGTVSLSKEAPQMDITIGIAPFSDNPTDFNLPNPPNAFWTGEHFFYLYCNNIQNALFDGNRESTTVQVPVESDFDYQVVFDNAANIELIDFNLVAGGTNGIYPVPESRELTLTAGLSGDVRKMIDAGVFTDIHLPKGYFTNNSGISQNITYQIKARSNISGSEAYMPNQSILLAENGQTPFYTSDFAPQQPISAIHLGQSSEGNAIFNELNFTFDYSMLTVTDAVYTCFLDNEGQYLQHQLRFSDEAPPEVISVSTGTNNAFYGDDIPVIIEFTEPVHTDGITFKVDDQTLSPMEGTGTISQRVSFLYRIGDEALNVESHAINVSYITGAKDLSGKAQVVSGSGSASVDISFDTRHTFAYCAEPSVYLDQGTGRNMSAAVSIPINEDTELSNWLMARVGEGNISTAVKAMAITADGAADIPLTLQTDLTRVTGLAGSFTVPENNTGGDVLYALEIYLDTGSGYKLVDSLVTIYAVQPLILVDDENDITLDYTYWPLGDKISIDTKSSFSLGYLLNVDATWVGSEYFSWSSSSESVAEIDENGDILIKGIGQVYFTLTVTNPLSEDKMQFKSRALTVLEAQDVYLYVPNSIKNQDLLIGNNAKISFSSNLPDRNDLYGGSGTATAYTFTLYEAAYEGGDMKKGTQLSSEIQNATAAVQLNSYTVPEAMLTKVTAKNRYGYILEISAEDIYSGITLTTEAYIRIRQLPAKASLIRPESVFILDSDNSFEVEFDIENKTSETEYSLIVIKNNETIPVYEAAFPEGIGPMAVNIEDVGSSRLLDVYTVSLKAKNPSDEAWSYDSYCVYVYNRSAMVMLLDGFPAPGSLSMDYDFEDGEIVYSANFLKYRSSIGRELLRTVKIDDRSYTWSAIADRVTWQVEGESVSLWYGGRRIGDSYNPALLPGTSLLLKGDGAGSSVVTATHTLTGMTDTMNVTLEPLNDRLFLFRIYPGIPCKLLYTNGNGQEKTIDFTGEVGIYEESGIRGDAVFYPTSGAETVYDFSVINHNTLMANQKSSSSFDLYPVNTVRLQKLNYNVSLELFDEASGEPYTGEIIVRGGVYLNEKYQKETTINGQMGNGDQRLSADENGRYRLSFKPGDFTHKLLVSDELRYVIEVGFADNSHITQYITIENDAIQAQKSSPLGVCLAAGIKALDASSIQNSAVVLSQTLTIDGEEKPIYDRILLTEQLENAQLEMTVMVPQYSHNLYRLVFSDSTGGPGAGSDVGERINAYPFSDTFTLKVALDFTHMLKFAHYFIKPGDTACYYPIIRSADGEREIKLPKPLQVQNLVNVPEMDYSLRYGGRELSEIKGLLYDMAYPDEVSFSETNKAVKGAIDILKGHSLDTSSFGLEIKPTDDPLVYKGIIRFAVGSYSKDNPSGVFVGSGENISYNFMPGVSDIKAMAKGTFMKMAKAERNGSWRNYKTFGGGAYIESLVYYSIDEREWKISLIYGDFYLGAGRNYNRTYNGWVSFVPVTATFQFSMTAEMGLTILNSQKRNETAYIPRIRPVFSVYGFGGAGFDYKFAGFKAGPYGLIQHEQLYQWYTDNTGLKMDGQMLKVSGEVGVEFDIWLTFIKLNGKYVLADYSKSWTYNDYKKIQDKIAKNSKERSVKGFFAPGLLNGSEDERMLLLVPVEESSIFEGRSYLNDHERFWGSPSSGRRMLSLFSAGELTDIWTNAYPNAMPQLSDDGELMVYMSDMDSEDLSDTAALFTVKDGTGSFRSAGTEIAASDYPDSSPSLSGTKGGASAVWIRNFADIDGKAGSEAAMEDIIKGLAASEVMAGIYKDGTFTSARLTDNNNPDIAPVTAASGEMAIAAWRSVTLGDMENPLGFTGDYIMYSVYDGSDWSEAKCLYDGSIDRVHALNTAMLPDGSSAVVYQISKDNDDSEIFCAVLNTDGQVVRNLLLTDNTTDEVNPQITTAEFPDGKRRFVIGWNAQTESGEGLVQMVAVNAEGTIYPEFLLEVADSAGASGYSSFRFTKGADKLEDLSLVWSEPEDADKDGAYEYSIFGNRLLVAADNTVAISGKQRLLALNEDRALDYLDSRVDSDVGKVHFVMLLSEPGEASILTTAAAEYENILTVEEPYYEYEDLLPGLGMPVIFTLINDGLDPINHMTIELGGQIFEYEGENIAPGEVKTYLVSYSVPEVLENADFTVTAQFGDSGDTDIQTGTLKLGLPDIGIYKVDGTKETQRERGFRVQLQNTAFADLVKGKHNVKLEVWDSPDFTEGSPLKTLTVSDADFDMLNDSILSLDFTLTERDLVWLLDENGEIPKGGAYLLFRVVLTEDGNVVEDSDISNDMDFVNVYSLIEKNGAAVSLASLSQATEGKTTVKVEAFNNSLKTIINGNIIVTLRDEKGNVLETKQTYNPADGSGLLSINGEELQTASIMFSRTCYTADTTFARVSGESTLLSVLNLTGIPMEFNSNVLEYNLKTYDLSQTILTAVAENPESTVSVTKNGVPVSISVPTAIPYGTTVFVIKVTTGEVNTTYKVTVENKRLNDAVDPGDNRPDRPGKHEGDGSDGNETYGNYHAEFTIGGIRQRDINISLRGEHAVVSLGSMAQEILYGDNDVVLDIPAISGVEGYTLEVPANSLAGPYTKAAVTVSTELGSVRIPAGMLAGAAELEGKTAGINILRADKSKLSADIREAIGDRPMLSLTLTLDGEQAEWKNPGAPVTLTIPYIPTAEELKTPESIIVWYIDGSGKAVPVPNGRYEAKSGTVTFTTDHFSSFAVGYNKVGFNDVAENAWYKQAVYFIAARGITLGTGNSKFSPEINLTRGQYITMLLKALEIEAVEISADNFSDAGDAYYTGYLASAKQLGISVGVGSNMFAPDKAITRQEMFTLLYNALRALKQLPEMNNSDEAGRSKSLSDFTDEGQIASWAKKAMALLVETDIINGSNGKLTPEEITTRAQMAQVLYKLMTK